MALSPERRQQMDMALGRSSTPTTSRLSPERRQQMDNILGKSMQPTVGTQIPGAVKTDNYFGDVARNILPSAGEQIKGIGNVVLHPIQTVKNLGNLALGAGELLIPGEQGKEQLARNVGQFYRQRYGGLQNIKETFRQDPVGVLADIATVASAGSGALKLSAKGATTLGELSTAEKLAQAGKTLGTVSETIDPLMASTKAIGKVSTPAVNSIFRKAQEFVPPENIKNIQLAEKYGVDLPMSARRPSPVVQNVEAIASKGFFGKPITDKITSAFEKVNQQRANLRASQAPQALDTFETGQRVKGAFEKYVGDFTKQASEKYDAIPNLQNIPAQRGETVSFLENIVSSKQRSKVPTRDLPFYQQALDGLKGVKKINAEDLRETIKAVGARIDDNTDIVAKSDIGSLKKLYSTLENDLKKTLETTPETSAIYKQLQGANRYYGKNIEAIRSKVGRDISNMNPEQILDSVIKPNNQSGVKLLKEVVGEQGLDPLRKSFVDKIVFQSLDSSNEFIVANKLRSNINKYGLSTLKELLTPKQYDNLTDLLNTVDELENLKGMLSKSQKVAEGSQTAFVGNIAGTGFLGVMNPQFLIPYLLTQATAADLVSGASKISQVVNKAKSVLTKSVPYTKGIYQTLRGVSKVNTPIQNSVFRRK